MTKKTFVLFASCIAIAIFVIAALLYEKPNETSRGKEVIISENSLLVRPHSVIMGPLNAPVTIVEFFDPACEACRAFYPIVKKIQDSFPDSVRLVLRYAAFHEGSDEAVRILETARIQNKYKIVLEALLRDQPKWADHGKPNIGLAWKAAENAGLDIERAKKDMMNPNITAILSQDSSDLKRVGVRRTPTFFVNGKPLQSFGAQQLYDLVSQEVKEAQN